MHKCGSVLTKILRVVARMEKLKFVLICFFMIMREGSDRDCLLTLTHRKHIFDIDGDADIADI